jgi:hypothetical protein
MTTQTAFFASRNKDNVGVKNFKVRQKSLSYTNEKELREQFNLFVEQGVWGETSRCYVSFNETDEVKMCYSVVHELLNRIQQGQVPDLNKLIQLAIGESNKKANLKTKKCLIDVDTKSSDIFKNVVDVLNEDGVPIELTYETPNGYHILCSRGLNPKLLEGFDDVEIKGTVGNLLKWIDKKDTLDERLDEIVDEKFVAKALTEFVEQMNKLHEDDE